MHFTPYLLDGLSPARHLAVESVLLEAEAHDDALLLLYINDQSIIIGRNQNPWREVAEGCRAPVYRRISGGGTVYHDRGNLNWALLTPRHLHDQEAELRMMAEAISGCGVSVSPGERGGLYCDTSSGYGGMKVSGTARRIGSRRVLHHGTALVSADLAHMRACLGGESGIDDHAVASVPAHAVNLADIRPGLSIATLMEAICLRVSGEPARPYSEEALPDLALEAETSRMASYDWVYGMTPPFVRTVGSPGHVARIIVEGGLVRGIETVPEARGVEALVGMRYTTSLVDRLAKALPDNERVTNLV